MTVTGSKENSWVIYKEVVSNGPGDITRLRMSFLYYTVGESHWPFMSQYDKKGTTSIICAIIIKVNSWNKNANCPKYQFCFQKDTENNHIRDSAN